MYDHYQHYRAFIAIVPPLESRIVLRDVNRKLKKFSRNFRFVAIDQLHITLQFLGNSVSGYSIAQIEESLRHLISSHNPFEIELGNLNFGFPGQNIASLLYYDLKDDLELRSFVKDVHSNLQTLGLDDIKRRKDHSKLINHMTVARTKSDMSRSFTREIGNVLSTLEIPSIKFDVTEVVVMGSNFKDGKTSYSTLVSLPLKT